MPTVRVVSLGDTHFGGLNSIFGVGGDDLIYRSLDQVLTFATENGIKHVIQPGDLFDSANPSQATIVRLFDWFRDHPHLTFWLIEGNHEKNSADDSGLDVLRWVERLRVLPNVRLFSRPTMVRLDGVPFAFLPHPYYYWPRPLDMQAVHIAHVDVAGARGDNGHVLRSGVKLSEIRNAGHVYMIGHLHTYQELTPDIVFGGTTFQKTFGEALPKGFIHATIEWNDGRFGRKSIDYVPIRPSFVLETIHVETVDDLRRLKPPPTDTYYSLQIHRDAAIPEDLFDRFPNILKHSRFADVEELVALNVEDLQVSSLDVDQMIDEDLVRFMESRRYAPEKVTRARGLMTDILKGDSSGSSSAVSTGLDVDADGTDDEGADADAADSEESVNLEKV